MLPSERMEPLWQRAAEHGPGIEEVAPSCLQRTWHPSPPFVCSLLHSIGSVWLHGSRRCCLRQVSKVSHRGGRPNSLSLLREAELVGPSLWSWAALGANLGLLPARGESAALHTSAHGNGSLSLDLEGVEPAGFFSW